MIKLTYFTPTYNRAKLLEQLYNSLIRQTKKDFIWLIIDDGSTDNTKKVVQTWIDENKINIKYVYKQNGGKNTAIELSNQICETEFISCIDSDDFLTDNATEIIYEYLDSVKSDDIVGIVGRRAHYNSTPFNTCWAKDKDIVYFYDIYPKYGYKEDTILIFKTNIIKQYHFPVIEDERFVTESVFYKQFLYDYKMIMMLECVYLAEYQEVGYTSQGMDLFFKNPKGAYISYKTDAYCNIKYGASFKQKVISMALMYSWQKLFKFKNLYKNQFSYSWFYKICGKLGMLLVYPKIKKRYNTFLKRYDKNR